jgi:Secretion system C-terminal sorting domain
MFKVVSLAFLLLMTFSTQAQVTILKDTVWVNDVIKGGTYKQGIDSIINATPSDVVVTWHKLSSVMPSGWTNLWHKDNDQCVPADTLNLTYSATVDANKSGFWATAVQASNVASDGPAYVTFETSVGNMTFVFNAAPLAVSSSEWNNLVKLYPNPSSNFITIESPSEISLAQLIDMRGSICKTWDATILLDKKIRLDVSSMQKGNYVMRITAAEKKETYSKLIVIE